MRSPGLAGLGLSLLITVGCGVDRTEDVMTLADEGRRILIAHRGASAYAPEHTLDAYRLAMDQGADFVEPDLQVTSDGVLICLHDLTLDRTTNVEEAFPDRFREEESQGRTVRRWYASDFTLEEIRRLDAGSWFDERFRGASVPTLAEAIELVLGRAGLYPETKAPEVYGDLGLDMERLLVAELERTGLLRPGTHPATPVVIQSFSPESLRILRGDLGVELPLTLLIGGAEAAAEWLTPEGLARAREFADGIGPTKGLLLETPALVERIHEAGMQVVPYTFASRNTGDFATVTEEMAYFLYELGVDALFTNNPDEFPRRPARSGS
ncbi:MAG: glycerophosphodiester phosphodiesterase family protein [Gemmatimonadota bacterium]